MRLQLLFQHFGSRGVPPDCYDFSQPVDVSNQPQSQSRVSNLYHDDRRQAEREKSVTVIQSFLNRAMSTPSAVPVVKNIPEPRTWKHQPLPIFNRDFQSTKSILKKSFGFYHQDDSQPQKQYRRVSFNLGRNL